VPAIPVPASRLPLIPFGQYDENMNLGFGEMAFIFIVALIIFGPKKLPEIGRQIGKALNEFKRASNEFKAQIEAEISHLETQPEPQILPPAYPPAGSVAAHSVQEAVVVPEVAALPETTAVPEFAAPPEAPLAKAPDA
jgi:sec-independent protein translocase protein TatB